jgi:exopolysaccharide biosynthesis protein
MKKGYVSAMFLDGGSSSSMAVKGMVFTANGKERYVASGLLVFPRR